MPIEQEFSRPSKESTDTSRASGALRTLRAREYARLDADGAVYVDFTGGGLYGASQVRRHGEMLSGTVFGNPHSLSPVSIRATEAVASTRRRILDFFRADPDEYLVIFTANASHALKIVGESYPFSPHSQLLLSFDNHNSVLGIREYARARHAAVGYIPLDDELRIAEATLDAALATRQGGANNLFAYPAQSNFSGVQHPLEWIARAHDAGWDVLLDAAAFVPTNRLDLSRYHPDFVSLSFYKMFGYPTGVGALIARRATLAKLERPWFAGGTISVASVQSDRHILAPGEAAFEDGTVDYLGIPAVTFGFDIIDEVGIDAVNASVKALTRRLLEGLAPLQQTGGTIYVQILGPVTSDRRGGTVALNFHSADGACIDHREIELRAGAERISLRTGCFCNPGASEIALRLSKREIDECFPAAVTGGIDSFRDCMGTQKGTGAVRISFGIASCDADVDRVLEFARAVVAGGR